MKFDDVLACAEKDFVAWNISGHKNFAQRLADRRAAPGGYLLITLVYDSTITPEKFQEPLFMAVSRDLRTPCNLRMSDINAEDWELIDPSDERYRLL
jgi:hypothetical protein